MNPKIIRRNSTILSLLVLALVVVVLLSINAGYAPIPMSAIIDVFLGRGSAENNLIVFSFRLPRLVMAVLVGIGFSLSGLVLQGLVKNPLADPGLIGVNAGAGLVVVLFVLLGGTMGFASIMSLPILSFIGAAGVGVLIYKLSKDKKYGMNPMRLILNGIAIQAGINALMTVIVVKLDESQHEFLALWQAGSIWRSNWQLVVALLPWIVILSGYVFYKAKFLDAMVLGDHLAKGIGVPVEKTKRQLLFAAIALASSSVAMSGSISFVGLIAPHLTRRLVGSRHTWLIPACALTGGFLVLTADTIGRTLIQPAELPTGIVVSIIGAPYFLYLMVSQSRRQQKKA